MQVQKHPKEPVRSKKASKNGQSMSRVFIDNEGGYETESDSTLTSDEVQTAGTTKRKHKVRAN